MIGRMARLGELNSRITYFQCTIQNLHYCIKTKGCPNSNYLFSLSDKSCLLHNSSCKNKNNKKN